MKPTNSFQTNDDYYRKLFGKKDATEKKTPSSNIVDRAGESLCQFSYSIVPSENQSKTYTAALEELNNSRANVSPKHLITIDGKEYVRPLTFKETLEARLDAYNSRMTREEETLLFTTPLSTCTGIVYGPKYPIANHFKIIPFCKELITLDSRPLHYDLLPGVELDKTQAIYGDGLGKAQVKKHPAWLAAVEFDDNLLNEYVDLVFSLSIRGNMGFWLSDVINDDHLHPLTATIKGADSLYTIRSKTHFLRIENHKPTNQTD